ncbi:MAG: FMN-binding negative transcriptional regulator [Burkholderiales bacterium]|nr:FMN-binding negative transcriptional regulator [Burkholderiales bacterium]
MYLPDKFKEERLEVLQELIRSHPLGSLVTLEDGALNANHLPFLLTAPSADAPYGKLQGHISRSNLLWQNHDGATEALVLFQGPHAYVTPTWYEEKERSGAVVPTYNYAVVHAHGPLRVMQESQELLALLQRLTDRFESGRSAPWQVDDAPPAFIERLMDAIVGIEIPITRISGKWKTSQNMTALDRITIANGLRAQADGNSVAMAEIMEHQVFEEGQR